MSHGYRAVADPRLSEQQTTGMLLEGVAVVKALGYKEYTRGDNPSWMLLKSADKLPEFLTDIIFRQSMQSLALNSMAQDVLRHGKAVTELELLNECFIEQAQNQGIDIPFIKTIVASGRERYGQDLQPIPEKEIWDLVRHRT